MPTYLLHIAYILSPKSRLHIKVAYISPTVFGSTARRMRMRVRMRVRMRMRMRMRMRVRVRMRVRMRMRMRVRVRMRVRIYKVSRARI